MRPDITARWIENLGTVKVSRAIANLCEKGGLSQAQAKANRTTRVALHNHAFHTNEAFVAAGPRLVAPAASFRNGIRFAA